MDKYNNNIKNFSSVSGRSDYFVNSPPRSKTESDALPKSAQGSNKSYSSFEPEDSDLEYLSAQYEAVFGNSENGSKADILVFDDESQYKEFYELSSDDIAIYYDSEENT